MSGHGWTDQPAIDYEVKNCADHVLAVLKISQDKAMISGESLGGWAAVYLAVHRPGAARPQHRWQRHIRRSRRG
jgi:2-hydroxy-6-oxonona-2,4-dienedioate hydrolase